jgi:hypothetical protein
MSMTTVTTATLSRLQRKNWKIVTCVQPLRLVVARTSLLPSEIVGFGGALPQGLKPGVSLIICGTTEVVPFQSDAIVSSLVSRVVLQN